MSWGGDNDDLSEFERDARKEPVGVLLTRLAELIRVTEVVESSVTADTEHLSRLFSLYKAHVGAMSSYVPVPSGVGGRVILISADHAFGKGLERAPDHGWNTLVPIDRMTRHAIATANHYTILEAPNVKELAALLKDVLQSAGGVLAVGV